MILLPRYHVVHTRRKQMGLKARSLVKAEDDAKGKMLGTALASSLLVQHHRVAWSGLVLSSMLEKSLYPYSEVAERLCGDSR